MKSEDSKYQLLYDAQCGFCSGIVRWIEPSVPHEKVDFIDQNSREGKQIISERFTDFDNNTVVLIAETKTYQKSDAIIELCRLTKNAWRTFVLFRIVPPGIRNWVYDRIARNRHWLFCQNTCQAKIK